jgi:hypothetical protein
MNYRRDAIRTVVALSALVALGCTDSPAPSEPNGVSPSFSRSSTAQDRLAALFPETSAEVLALPGTVFADHDESSGKLVFGVENANAAQGVERSLAARGVSTSDYRIRIVPPIRQLAHLQTSAFRPTIAGVQIHFGQYVCTLGFNVTHSSGDRSFITNSHCTNTQGGVEGTTYAQPNRNTHPEVIATEVADPLYTAFPGCSRGKVCRYSDASRANYSANVESTQGAIAQTTGVNNMSLETVSTPFTIGAQDNNTRNFPLGMVVNKVGRTTGWASGQVTNTCVTVNVSQTKFQQHCQTIVENPSAVIVRGGDSGSPIFTLSGTNATLVGILWGGGGDHLLVFSPLNNIQQELGSVNAVSGSGGGGGGGEEPPPEEEPPCVPKGPKGNNCK